MKQPIRIATMGLTVLGLAVGVPAASAAGNRAGTLDTTFGTGGVTVTSLTTASNTSTSVNPSAVALQSNGDILVLADNNFTNDNGAFTSTDVLRFTAAGALDKSFGNGGVVQLPTNLDVDLGQSLALQSNGQILVAGVFVTSSGAAAYGVERLNTNGTVDTTFGSDGLAAAALTRSPTLQLVLLPETNGDILLGGQFEPTGRRQPVTTALVRFTSAGKLDSTFGSGGTVNVTANGGCTALAELSTGEIQVVDGEAIAQFTSAGVQESATTTGTIVASAGSQAPSTPSVFQPNGDFLVAGPLYVGEESRGHNASTEVLRFTNTGAADSSFANPSFHFEGSGGNDIEALPAGIAVGPNGDIVVSGVQISYTQSGQINVNGLARITPSGDLDSTFGSAGTVANSVPAGADGYYKVAIEPSNNNIVVVGLANNFTELTVSRYLGQ